MKQGAEKHSNNNILPAFILNALSRRKKWMQLILIPQFSSIKYVFTNIKASVRTFYFFTEQSLVLYSKLSVNQCVVKERYDNFVFEIVHMSLVNYKKRSFCNSVYIFIFKLSQVWESIVSIKYLVVRIKLLASKATNSSIKLWSQVIKLLLVHCKHVHKFLWFLIAFGLFILNEQYL